ncbi:MAG: sulfatase-like hydrolase/transferase [Bacteroidota bacterium]
MISKPYTILVLMLSSLFMNCTRQQLGMEQEQPNIIFIISDDQAYGDYGFMGHEFIETPNIDQLAQTSATFTRGYASAPLCSPSLASIITGLYTYQHGITGNDPVVDYEGPKRPPRAPGVDTFPSNSYPVQRSIAYQTLADRFYQNKLITQTLAENGYRSFQTGKWWVGSAEDAGFDEGMTHGDYMRGGRHGDEGLKIGREGLDPIYDFIAESDSLGQPFFLWYAPFLPHTPHTPPSELEEKYAKVAPSPSIARYWAMVEWFDQTVGALQDHLEETGLDENTIIVYTCDNGWIQDSDSRSYAPLSKRSPFEGGIRTPIMFKYPDKITPSIDQSNLISNVDIVPTIHALLGLEVKGLPGINILDKQALEGRKTIFAAAYNHDIIDIHNPSASVLYKIAIEKDWKLLLPNPEMIKEAGTTKKEHKAGYYTNEMQLYKLSTDPKEKNNVAAQYPTEVKRLTEKIDTWWKPGD